MRSIQVVAVAALAGVVGTVSTALGQPLGTYRWQLAPHCNVLALSVTRVGAEYRLEGFDDQCGAVTRVPVTGHVIPNLDGSLELGLTVASPGGPQHVNVTLNIATLGGPWRDSGGRSGLLVFNPGPAAGAPRPAGLGAVAIDPDQVQTRVDGSCSAGEFIKSVGTDGSVDCEAAAGGGTITSVSVGPGLTGGGTSGAVALGVDTSVIQARVTGACAPGQYVQGVGIDGTVSCGTDAALALAGSGAAATAARSDHTHEANASSVAIGPAAFANGTGSSNTAVGVRALNLNTVGSGNTGIGIDALRDNTGGSANTAIGSLAMRSITMASNNTALGAGALASNQTGWNNVAIGVDALLDNTIGEMNVAVGSLALTNVTTGNSNVAIGEFAGINLMTGSNNLYVSNFGDAADSGTIRIGTDGRHTATYIAGILGGPVPNQATVLIDTVTGRLGYPVSSARFKDDIRPLDGLTARLHALRPVSFVYKAELDAGGAREPQFGLIAEEVADVMPELVVRDAEGRPQTVRYHLLAPLLLAEVQRLERERAGQAREIAELRAMVEALGRPRQ